MKLRLMRTLAVAVPLTLILFLSMRLDAESERELMRDYCLQVETFIITDGEYGWPDYKRVYATQCNDKN